MDSNFKVTILGCNSAVPSHGRNQTAQLIQIHKKNILIDCGESTQQQLMKIHGPINKIDIILISHLHGDHFFGLMPLLSTMNLYGRKSPLEVFASPGLQEIVNVQCHAAEIELGFEIIFRPLQAESLHNIFSDHKFEIFAFPLKHRIVCFGFLIQEKAKKRHIIKANIPEGIQPNHYKDLQEGKDIEIEHGRLYRNEELTKAPDPSYSYAYCSDTVFDTSIANYIKNVTCLYHEATFLHELEERALHTMHSTSKQAATIAGLVQAKMLILGHFSVRYKYLHPFLEEAKSVFENSFLAEELKTFPIDL